MELFPVCFRAKGRAERIRENAEAVSGVTAETGSNFPPSPILQKEHLFSPFAGHGCLGIKDRQKQNEETAQHIPFFMLKPFPTKNKEAEKTVCRRRTAWAHALIREEEAVSCPTCKSVITVCEGVREKKEWET